MNVELSWLRPMFFAAVVGGVAVAACGLDTTGQGGEAPPVAKSEFPDKAAETVCGWFYQCNCDELDGSPFTSEDQCNAELGGDFQAAVDEGDDAELIYSAKCAGEVLEFLDELGCSRSSELGVSGIVKLTEALDCKLFYGEKEAGASCTSLDMSSGDTCVEDAWCDEGTCKAITQVPGPGDSCESGDLCSGGAWCVDVEGTGSFACEVLPAEGDTCLGVLDMCDEGLSCEQTTKECEEAPDAGSQCASTPLWQCADGLYCGPTNLCTALPPGGEACADTQFGLRCDEGLICEEGTCVAEDPLACGIGPVIFNLQ